jgi:hypothetical protein
MAEQVFGFYEDVARKLRDMVRGGGDSVQNPGLPPNQRYCAIALTDAAIPARSGTQAGTGVITLCQLSSTGAISTTAVTENVCNIFCDETPGSAYIKVTKEYIGGQWVVDQVYISDLRLDGSNLQYRKNCSWTTWTTGTDCPPP